MAQDIADTNRMPKTRKFRAAVSRYERVWDMFEQDPVLGDQLLNTRVSGRMCGEKALQLGIIENAVNDYQKYAFASGVREARLFRQVEAWLFEDSHDSDEVVLFKDACENLNLDADVMRRGLLRWKEVQAKEPNKRKRKISTLRQK